MKEKQMQNGVLLLIVCGCSGSIVAPMKDASIDVVEDVPVYSEPLPTKIGNQCCKMEAEIQDCDNNNFWECWPGYGSYSFPCNEANFCYIGEYCIGVAGPGYIVECQ
jgi:hypothetical protein